MPLNIKALRTSLYALSVLTVLASFLVSISPASAAGNVEPLPDFAGFVESVQNNQPGVLRGVYVPHVLALPIVQQPAGNPGFVSRNEGEITQFDLAAQFGNVGLLAHNDLSGRFFSQLAIGQEVRLVYGDGRIESFLITGILRYQAMQPDSPYSTFRDLTTHELLTAEQMFKGAYAGDRHVTFQTCIARAETASWGRLFVIATPKLQFSGANHFQYRWAQ